MVTEMLTLQELYRIIEPDDILCYYYIRENET